MSDFEDFGDLDAVRDFRGLTDPFPPATEARVRRRIVDLAAERGYGRPAARRAAPVAPAKPEHPPPTGPPSGPVLVLERSVRRTTRRTSRLLVGAALTVVLVLAATLVARQMTSSSQVDTGGRGTEQPASEAATTSSPGGLVRVVGGLPDRQLAAGERVRIRVERSVRPETDTAAGEVPQEMIEVVEWSAPATGAGVFRREPPTVLSGDEVLRGEHPYVVERPGAEAFDGVSYEWLRALPTDPAALRAQFEQQAGTEQSMRPLAQRVVGKVLERLVQPVLPPPVRAAAVRLLASDFALRSLGPRADRRGRTGEAFAVDDGAGTWTVVFEPGGRVLGWERHDRARDLVDTWVVVEAAAVEAS